MMPEIGNGLLCLALGIALLLSVYPLWGVARGDARMMASSRLFAWLLFMSVAGAFLVLVNAFVVNDFTVTYVASNSNTQLPVWYRVAVKRACRGHGVAQVRRSSYGYARKAGPARTGPLTVTRW